MSLPALQFVDSMFRCLTEVRPEPDTVTVPGSGRTQAYRRMATHGKMGAMEHVRAEDLAVGDVWSLDARDADRHRILVIKPGLHPEMLTFLCCDPAVDFRAYDEPLDLWDGVNQMLRKDRPVQRHERPNPPVESDRVEMPVF